MANQLKLFYFGVIIAVTPLFYSCEGLNEKVLPRPTGNSGSLLVIVDSSYWQSKIGKAIMEVFAQEQVGLPQREPLFDIVQLAHENFVQIFKTNRNILVVDINPSEKNKISINAVVWSSTQLVVTISAVNDEVAAETIYKNKQTLIDYFNNKEIERLKLRYVENKNQVADAILKKKFNLSMNLESYYRIASEDTNFVWFRKDKRAGEHPINQGIMVYSYPYTSDSTFSIGSLVAARNEITKKYIHGTYDSTYMQTYSEFLPAEKEINLNGLYAKELRGLWYLKGDFMGGPFVNYTFVDEKKARVICIDGYVFAPKFDKREYLRELEAFVYTAKINN